MDTEYIKEVIEKDIERLGCKVWGLELFGRHSNQTLRIYIDNKEGISVEDCELVSKHVSKVLDTENDFSENYLLEVSSPGLDRKFFYKEQYKEFLKENLKVTFFDDLNKKTIKGQLEEVDEISIKLEVKDEIQEIPFSSIIKANLLI
ncbi:ribosome maturation factor RimP [Gammaproteobacteria bacterium]|nr:ribosome maturation factor RimP [Gammaproteobacteria bacterium]